MLKDITASILIEAPRERVWRAMTEDGLVEQWLGCIGFRAEIGALFYMQPDQAKHAKGDVEGATNCEIECLEQEKQMAFSWFVPGTPKTHVRIDLSDQPDGNTLVSLSHTGWNQFDEQQLGAIHDMLDKGWRSFVLPGLRRVAATLS